MGLWRHGDRPAVRYLGLFALLVDALFLVTIAFGAPAIAIPPCAAA